MRFTAANEPHRRPLWKVDKEITRALVESLFVHFNLAAKTGIKLIVYSEYFSDDHKIFKRYILRIMTMAHY